MFGSGQMFTSSQVGESLGFGASPPATANSPEKRPRQEEKQTCLPVTIRAMEVAVEKRAENGDEIKFFGSEPTALIVVAAVESVVRQSTGLELTLNDSTGRIKARYFVTDPQPGHCESIVAGRYISAFGNVRAAPALHFAIQGIRLVESADEVSYHMIEAAYAALRLLQGPKELPATPAPKRAAVEAAPDVTPQKAMGGVPAATPAAAAMPAAAAPVEAAKPAGAPSGADLRAGVLEAIRAEESAEGLALSALFGKFASASQAQLREIVDGLVGEGEIFGTIDEEHFSAV